MCAVYIGCVYIYCVSLGTEHNIKTSRCGIVCNVSLLHVFFFINFTAEVKTGFKYYTHMLLQFTVKIYWCCFRLFMLFISIDNTSFNSNFVCLKSVLRKTHQHHAHSIANGSLMGKVS